MSNPTADLRAFKDERGLPLIGTISAVVTGDCACIEIADAETYARILLTVKEAAALRDWLNKVLP